MFSDLFKSIYSFRHYTEMAKKNGRYAFLYALVIFVIIFIGGYVLINQYTAEIPPFLKTLPPVEVKNGELLVDGGRPYKTRIPQKLTPGRTFYAQYNPALEFPPEETDFINNNVLIIVTKKALYLFNGSVQHEPLNFTKDFPKTEGPALAAMYAGNAQIQAIIKIGSAIGMLVAAILMFAYWFVVNALLCFAINAFMLRDVPKGAALKLAVFVMTPFIILFLIHIFVIAVPYFTLAQAFLSAIYLQQILNHYPKKAVV